MNLYRVQSTEYCLFETVLAKTRLHGVDLPRTLTKFRDTAEILYALRTLPNRLTQIRVPMHMRIMPG